MRSKKRIGVYLSGGLGNQLFQLAAAISNSQGRGIEVIDKPGHRRLNSNNDPEIFDLTVDTITNIYRRKEEGFLLGKSIEYILRISIRPRRIEKNKLFLFTAISAATVLHSLCFRRLYFPLIISEPGSSNITRRKLVEKFYNPFLIGYFQSFVWPESVRPQLQALTVVKEGPDLRSLRLEAELLAPVIIHVRRGDYKELKDTYGIPGENYYRRAMRIIDGTYANHPVWIFSDEVCEARKILNWLPLDRVKFIPAVDGQAAASLMAMRLGCAYVIANSTFSWWGAFLSHCENPLVIAPKPWFFGYKEPDLLIPSSWIRVTHGS